MAENLPNLPTGAVPPTPAEAKVQPKKETVRINLPPKPTAAPTIKLPTLPSGTPGQMATGVAPPAATLPPAPPSAGGPAVPPPPPPPASASGSKLTTQRPGLAAPPAPRPSAPPAAPPTVGRISGFDKALAVIAMLVGIAAVGCMVYLMKLFEPSDEAGADTSTPAAEKTVEKAPKKPAKPEN